MVKKSQKHFKAHSHFLGEINGHVEEMYSGHLLVKTYNYEEESIRRFDELNEELYNAAYKSQFYSGIMHPLTGFLQNVGYVAVCLVGGFEVINGNMAIGDIQAFTTYVRRLQHPMTSIAQLMNTIQTMVAAAERVFNLLNETQEEEDRCHFWWRRYRRRCLDVSPGLPRPIRRIFHRVRHKWRSRIDALRKSEFRTHYFHAPDR